MRDFSVWAPAAQRVEVQAARRRREMEPGDRPGWWRAEVPGSGETDYAFRLDGGEPLPDPRSPRQPDGPAGASRTYDHSAFAWSDDRWRGAPLQGAVV
jgi:maltooligosyltrehalose trehalohydrolase